jgi:catechol 2,3-dioxygenase-like lactoylglutathione lyase family enzyme
MSASHRAWSESLPVSVDAPFDSAGVEIIEHKSGFQGVPRWSVEPDTLVALEVAMLRGDRQAMRRLHAAGAREPESSAAPSRDMPASLGACIGKLTPMLAVPDIEAAVAWYRAIGFELTSRHDENGRMDWAAIAFGDAEIMLLPSSEPSRVAAKGVSLWITTNRIDDLYARLKRTQLQRARGTLHAQGTDMPELRFTADLYTAFYGQREFGIRDPNGFEVLFAQPLERGPARTACAGTAKNCRGSASAG